MNDNQKLVSIEVLEEERLIRLRLEADLKEKNKKIKSMTEYNQSLFNSISVAIISLSSDGIIKQANIYAQYIFFKSDKSIIGLNILPFITINNSSIHDLNSVCNQELKVTFKYPDQKVSIEASANFSLFISGTNETEYLLTMKDLSEILKRDSEIRQLQEHLIDSAYRDGVAENAVSILHNIGNILTTMIYHISQEEILNDLALTPTVLSRISSTLNSFKSPSDFSNFILTDPKSSQIPKLIHELCKNSTRNEEQIKEVFVAVKNKCLDIAEIIKTQQQYANFRQKSKSKILAREIVNDCLLLHKEKISSRDIKVRINEFPMTHIFMDKVGLAQTISNALVNAVESIEERFNQDPLYKEKIITISTEVSGKTLAILFTDNGMGINPEALSKLFSFGFSTKNRSSGFGLHNCANYMASNNGKIEVLSDGIYLGATTKLTCPIID